MQSLQLKNHTRKYSCLDEYLYRSTFYLIIFMITKFCLVSSDLLITVCDENSFIIKDTKCFKIYLQYQVLFAFISLIELLYSLKHVTGSNNSGSYTLPMITRPKLCCLCGRMPLAICVLKNKNNIEIMLK